MRAWVVAAVALAMAPGMSFGQYGSSGARTYIGFDRNGYPGDDLLPALHRTFAYTGFWLNDPPGMTANPWVGKRVVVRAAGFGFLLLFNGRLEAQLKGQNAASLGELDGRDAVAAAERAGFPAGAIIFLDQEEGGALTKEQAVYMEVWIHAVQRSGEQHSGYRAGVYASGIAVPAGTVRMSTAQDVRTRFPEAALWVWNDVCPPSPGCVIPGKDLDPAGSGFRNAPVWQYAQSPRRPGDTARCAKTYASDGQCYAPKLPHTGASFVDLNVSRSADPSHGR